MQPGTPTKMKIIFGIAIAFMTVEQVIHLLLAKQKLDVEQEKLVLKKEELQIKRMRNA